MRKRKKKKKNMTMIMIMMLEMTTPMKQRRMRRSDRRLSPFSRKTWIFDAFEDTIEIDVGLEKKRRWWHRSADDYKDEYHTRWRGGPHRGAEKGEKYAKGKLDNK